MNVQGVEDSLGKAVVLTSTERMTQALNFLRRFSVVSYEDVEDFITVGVWNEPEQEVFFNILDEARAGGIAFPYLIPNLRTRLRIAVSRSFHMIDRVGGISGLGSMVFEPERGATPFKVYNSKMFSVNFEEGEFGRISGVPGSGKTNAACRLLIEEYVRPNRLVFTNIMPTTYGEDGSPEYPDPNVVYSMNVKELFINIAERGKDSKWIFILDEGGLVYSKPDAATRSAKDLDKLARVIRKLHGSFVVIEQRPDSIPTIIQEFSTVLFYCEKPPGIVNVELKGPVIAHRARIKDVPKTTLPFDTYDIAYFSVSGVNIPAVFEAISGSREPFNTMRDVMLRTKEARDSLRILRQENGPHSSGTKVLRHELPTECVSSQEARQPGADS